MGPVSYSSTPFEYAMNRDEYINNGSQERTYITYYSGWPTHLEIRYNEETDKNELIDYPTFAAIAGTGSEGAKYTAAKYPYMTAEHIANMTTAVSKYNNNEQLTDYEREIINAALNLVLPEGIESVKEGLYIENEARETRTDLQKTITAYSLKEVEEGAFKGCKFLIGVTLSDATEKIGNYAFEGCENLSSVNFPGTVREMGLRPFKDCPKLTTVGFSGGPYFTCENSIIYELDDSGAKEKIVECLEGRANPYVTATEVAGVKELYQEAFMATDLVNVDLSSSSITSVPEYAFAYTPRLTQVTLPNTIRNIRDNAFKNSNVIILKIPGQYQNITTKAFGDGVYDSSGDCHTEGSASDATDLTKLTIFCEEGSMAEDYAKTNNIPYSNEEPDNEYSVSFYDKDSKLIETIMVKHGEAATPPTPPEVEGYTFTGWQPTTYLCVTENIPYVQAQYEKNDVVLIEHTVTFVDDDENIAELISLYLTKECFDTRIVHDGESAMREFDTYAPNLVLLDLMLPGIDGYQVCRELRQRSSVPIIMLSAKGEVFDKVLGLELGADDYIIKPFDSKELVARVKAVLRRFQPDKSQAAKSTGKIVEYPDLIVNQTNYSVIYKGETIDMPPKELELLYFLASSPNQVFTREQLLDHIWGYEYIGDTRTVDVHIKRLREKIKENPYWALTTVWGIGYKFEVKNV